MGAEVLSSRAVIGFFFAALAAPRTPGLGLMIGGAPFKSDQSSEDYPWLGQVPMLREWVGGRMEHALKSELVTIKNVTYESSLVFKLEELRRDKTPQIKVRISEQIKRADQHWSKLVSALIAAGESGVCYDSQFYFDTDHAEGKSGTQSNDLSIDISALPVTVEGTTTAPSIEQASGVIQALVSQIRSFKDDQGEPMNEDAMEFALVVPSSLATVFENAVSMQMFPGGGSNPTANGSTKITVLTDARSAWTTKVALFRTDTAGARAFILQEEDGPNIKVKGEGSDFEYDTNSHAFGIDASRGVGYGLWQYACLATMT